jgi:hypothetical protein
MMAFNTLPLVIERSGSAFQYRPCLVSRRVSALDRIGGKRMFWAFDAFSHQARPPLSEPSSQTGRIYQEISYDPIFPVVS